MADIKETKLLLDHKNFKILLDELINQGEQILKIDISNKEIFQEQKEQYNQWNDYNTEFLKQNFNKQKNEYRNSYEKAGMFRGFLNPSPIRNERLEFKQLFQDKIANLEQLLRKVDLIKIENLVEFKEENIVSTKEKNDVFIVHGKDDATKYEVARFIEQLKLKPIILHEQPSAGTTIIEKIEKYTNVGFGIILYTACDVGAIKGQENNLQNRARQNVVFEHGYLVGKIGRNNVAALVKGNIEKPNDISGVVYILMENEWKIALIRELISSGYKINMEDIIK